MTKTRTTVFFTGFAGKEGSRIHRVRGDSRITASPGKVRFEPTTYKEPYRSLCGRPLGLTAGREVLGWHHYCRSCFPFLAREEVPAR